MALSRYLLYNIYIYTYRTYCLVLEESLSGRLDEVVDRICVVLRVLLRAGGSGCS